MDDERVRNLLGLLPNRLDDHSKDSIRRALIHSLSCDVFGDLKETMCRNVIADFYHSLNRHCLLSNDEVQPEIDAAYNCLFS